MTNHKPTRTDNNKPSQSTPIRKGTMTPDVITKVAEELTKGQLTTTGQAIKTYKSIVEKKAPKIEPVAKEFIVPKTGTYTVGYTDGTNGVGQKGNYKVFAETLKAVIGEFGQFEATTDQLKLFFPQVRRGGEVATNLKRSHGISYRRVENGRNDTYVFFVEPTREELIVMLTSAETRVTDLQHLIDVQRQVVRELMEENTQLKSDLFYSKRSNIITFAFAIGAVITIIFKSVAL